MRLVHLADLHLGLRQYQRLNDLGVNQREADVASTVQRAIAHVAALSPDLVVIGGDVFHTVRPSNPAILHAFRLLSDLREKLPNSPIVMVAGNHDAPRTAETGCILQLFREIGVFVADKDAECFTFPDQSLAVLAVPDVPGITRPKLVPPDGYKYRVLLMHGEVAGMLPAHLHTPERAAVEIPVAELHTESWNYIALGHYHVSREVAPGAWYSGSLDYTSSNPWGELREEKQLGLPGKGFIEHDLDSGEHRFHAVLPARPLLDLTPIDARGMSTTQIDESVRARVDSAPGGIDGAIVRITVHNVTRNIAREIDHAALRGYRSRATHFQLDMHRPAPAERGASSASRTLGAPGEPSTRRTTLREVVADRLRQRDLPAEMDRDAFVSLGLTWLDSAEKATAASLPAIEE